EFFEGGLRERPGAVKDGAPQIFIKVHLPRLEGIFRLAVPGFQVFFVQIKPLGGFGASGMVPSVRKHDATQVPEECCYRTHDRAGWDAETARSMAARSS